MTTDTEVQLLYLAVIMAWTLIGQCILREYLKNKPERVVPRPEDLKACPFCGGRAILMRVYKNDPKGWIKCDSCGMTTPTLRLDKAMERWNRRVEE